MLSELLKGRLSKGIPLCEKKISFLTPENSGVYLLFDSKGKFKSMKKTRNLKNSLLKECKKRSGDLDKFDFVELNDDVFQSISSVTNIARRLREVKVDDEFYGIYILFDINKKLRYIGQVNNTSRLCRYSNNVNYEYFCFISIDENFKFDYSNLKRGGSILRFGSDNPLYKLEGAFHNELTPPDNFRLECYAGVNLMIRMDNTLSLQLKNISHKTNKSERLIINTILKSFFLQSNFKHLLKKQKPSEYYLYNYRSLFKKQTINDLERFFEKGENPKMQSTKYSVRSIDPAISDSFKELSKLIRVPSGMLANLILSKCLSQKITVSIC